jgi:hypothetical protein
VHLSGNRLARKDVSPAYPVVAAAADGRSVILEKPVKGAAAEKIVVRLTETTRVAFANVARDGAGIRAGYEARVSPGPDALAGATAVTFIGTAEGKSAKGKDNVPDRSGRIVGVSADGKGLSVEFAPGKGKAPPAEVRLTEATRESYHGVAAGGARPVVGYLVQVWLAEGSPDVAARVRFVRPDPRRSVAGKIVAVSAAGDRITLDIPTAGKSGDTARREITVTAQTRLVFSDVGPGGARLTVGYHVRGWLEEDSEDAADDLLVSGSGAPDGKREKRDEK